MSRFRRIAGRVGLIVGLGGLWLAVLGGAYLLMVGLAYSIGNLPEIFRAEGSAAVAWQWVLRTVVALCLAFIYFWLLFHPRRCLWWFQRLVHRLSGERWFKPKIVTPVAERLENQLAEVEQEIEEARAGHHINPATPAAPPAVAPNPPFKPLSRRRFLIETAALGAYTVDAFYLEPFQVDITRLEVRLPNLPPAFEGLTIAHLTDIHVDPYTTAEAVDRMVAQANALKPDLTVVTGDFVSRGTYYFEQAARSLGALRDGSRLGLYGISGNHDHWADGNELSRLEPLLKKHGLPLIRNSATKIELNGDSLWLMGTDDSSTHNEDFGRTLRAAGFSSPEAARRYEGPKILLTHNPAFTRTALAAEPDLILSGHTHGGQVYVPAIADVIVSPIFPQFRGYYRVGQRTQVYVNRGAGVVGPPMRLLASPEILFLRLVKA